MACNTREENAADLQYEDDNRLDCQGVCKDCGNGTLNNRLNTAFYINEDNAVQCIRCDSTHVDIL